MTDRAREIRKAADDPLLAALPEDPAELTNWAWSDIEPFYRVLDRMDLSAQTVDAFLGTWSALQDRLQESYARRYVATTVDTADEEAESSFRAFLEQIYPRTEQADQTLKEKLLASGLEPAGMEEPIRKMHTQAALYREANLPLLVEDTKLTNEYNKIAGTQTVQWEGRELPIPQVQAILQEPDRQTRSRAWRLIADRQLADRVAINDLWRRLLVNRHAIAGNAGFDDYRAYRWQELLRLDYSPDDAQQFHEAIEHVVTPVVRRMHARRRTMLGIETLRPWDLAVDPLDSEPLRPFSDADDLAAKTQAMFERVDPVLGSYFGTMRRGNALDLESRKNKAPGGFCIPFALSRKPFIFMNAAGVQRDVETLLHEGGHAFHDFEMWNLPYAHQRQVAMEFAEVASMAMEFLSSPYLGVEDGGFYSPGDAARARWQHLESAISLWLTVAAVDLFQHWAYLHPEDAMDPERCDEQWAQLRRRLLPEVDYSGLEVELRTGWHAVLHIHVVPFYIIEYGLAQLGAVQIWSNARRDQAGAVSRYREALSLGGTRSLPELFAAAGARFALDAETLREAVSLIEETLLELEANQG
jgi:oligoendopeptidase F